MMAPGRIKTPLWGRGLNWNAMHKNRRLRQKRSQFKKRLKFLLEVPLGSSFLKMIRILGYQRPMGGHTLKLRRYEK
jgi:hypothetical protein